MTAKKVLIEKLIKDSTITLDEALVLLGNDEIVDDVLPILTLPTYSYYPDLWVGNYPFSPLTPISYPSTLSVTIPVNDTITNINHDPCTVSYITVDPKCISYTMN